MSVLRNIGNIALAVLLLAATTGVTLNKHYCMGRLKSVAINHHAPNCAGGEEADPMPCCEDVSQELKVEELTKVTFDFDAQPDLYQLAVLDYTADDTGLTFERKTKHILHTHSPPLDQGDPQVRHQVFLI